jgi:transcriptional regulator with XRE-family HTH domain
MVLTPPSKLALRRISLGLSQCDLERMTGIGQAAISRIETGRVRPLPATAAKLAAVLAIPQDQISSYFQIAQRPGRRARPLQKPNDGGRHDE